MKQFIFLLAGSDYSNVSVRARTEDEAWEKLRAHVNEAADVDDSLDAIKSDFDVFEVGPSL